MTAPAFTPEHLARHVGNGPIDKQVRNWLATLSSAERITFLKGLWSTNTRYALLLAQGARLSRQEYAALLRHWLESGNHNAAQALISYLEPVLGKRVFWRIAAQSALTEAMGDFLNYHSQGRLDAERSPPTVCT